MPITQSPTATTFGGMPGGMPMTTGLQNFGVPQFNSGAPVDASKLTDSNSQVYQLLAQNQPQSLTNMLAPYLAQLFGTQASQGVAGAQSDAQARGLTGSSIEAASMGQARSSASTSFIQSLIPLLMQTGQFDIGNQQGYYGNLASAVGQGYAQDVQQSEFQQQLQAGMSEASMANSSQNLASWLGLGGSAIRAGATAYASDIRLKEDIRLLGVYKGHRWYTFKYRQDTPFPLPRGLRVGIIAHEVAKTHPKALMLKKGYLWVDYSRLVN